MPVQRRADGRLGAVKTTGAGGVKVPASLTRTGILVYKRHDGSVQRELRRAEEVFSPDSLASIEDLPVTKLHPPGLVTAETFSKFAIGHVSKAGRQDGELVMGDLVVSEASAIAAIERGELQEISCGYECDFDATPGVFNGERYDGEQKSIRYNHVALGPKGWGRAGPQVSLRLDAAGNEVETSPRSETVKPLRIDGVDYDPTSDAFQQAFAKFMTSAGELQALLDSTKAQASTAEAKADAADARVKELQTKLDAATSPKELERLVNERTALVTQAAKLVPATVKLDGLTPAQIKRAVVEATNKSVKLDGKDAVYIDAAYDYIVASQQSDERKDSDERLGGLRKDLTGGRKFVRRDMEDSPFNQPLTITRDAR